MFMNWVAPHKIQLLYFDLNKTYLSQLFLILHLTL